MSYTYNLPLEINNLAFETMDFADRNYMTGFPSIMDAQSDQAYAGSYSDVRPNLNLSLYSLPTPAGYASKDYIYCFKGYQMIYLQPGKGFTAGADIRIYAKTAIGATRTVMACRVESYNAKTGLMWFDCYAVSLGLDFGSPENAKIPVASARVSIYSSKYINNGQRSIATGGTASNSYMGALASLGSRQSRDVSEYFHDCLSPAEGPLHVWNATGVYQNAYAQAQLDPTNHPGVIQIGGLTTTAANRSRLIMISPYPRFPGASLGGAPIGTMAAGSVFECLVYQPALSTATNEYTFEVGLKFTNLNGDVGQLLFTYVRTTATVFRVSSQMNLGAVSPSSTATTVTANTWYKFRIEFDGTLFKYYINGVLQNNVSAAALGSTNGIYSGLYIYSKMTWVAGTSPFYDLDYFYLKKVFAGGRSG